MAVRKILQYGDKVLNIPSEPVKTIDDEIKKLIKDMKNTLAKSYGIGLAAPQIGVLKKVILIDFKNGEKPIVLINPEIKKASGKTVSVEGCLSYEGFEGEVIRPKKVTVTGLNEENEIVQYEAEGILAKAFCHEIDHLDGIMYMQKAKKIYKLEE